MVALLLALGTATGRELCTGGEESGLTIPDPRGMGTRKCAGRVLTAAASAEAATTGPPPWEALARPPATATHSDPTLLCNDVYAVWKIETDVLLVCKHRLARLGRAV